MIREKEKKNVRKKLFFFKESRIGHIYHKIIKFRIDPHNQNKQKISIVA